MAEEVDASGGRADQKPLLAVGNDIKSLPRSERAGFQHIEPSGSASIEAGQASVANQPGAAEKQP